MVRTEPKKLTTDPSTETECRHCGALIRKRRQDDGQEQIWVSYIGNARAFIFEDGSSQWYSRFCAREVAEAMGGRRIQHAPPPAVPVHDAEKLERWLES